MNWCSLETGFHFFWGGGVGSHGAIYLFFSLEYCLIPLLYLLNLKFVPEILLPLVRALQPLPLLKERKIPTASVPNLLHINVQFAPKILLPLVQALHPFKQHIN